MASLNPSILIFTVSAVLTYSTFTIAQEKQKEPWELAMETEVWEPVPPVVTAIANEPPADAIVLFDGKNQDQWVSAEGGKPAQWKIHKQALTVNPKTGDIKTKESFC